ncbi:MULTISPECIES: tRNA pseudouridine(38-40) synthase TruA [Kordiimonas]|jgi:tRNA pseudouridine38-40 synthase|uniref:tRNA pseudouridine(38-40) synthase TruA n=1 Tax=Kordiimonas TaxID=288021 RepID=UPI00257E78EF|nr:tRNA pseudouridine(38-40) synthase TruA [Kordiimonas sp. UBA4487]
MQRFKLIVEYDGRPFVGWQRQENGPSVQATIEDAITKFAPGEAPRVIGSGRTDAGVHALGQVAHFDLERDMTPDQVQGALNYHMQPRNTVAIVKAEAVDSEFSARFDAVKRHYVYRIANRRAPLTFDAGLKWHVKTPLDHEAMHDAAQILVGQHDFTTFRHVACQAKSPVKTMDYLTVEREGDEVRLLAGARSFLHHQIRSIVGTLKLVGAGNWTKADVQAALDARDRQALGLNAPPDGLYFKHVEFEG